MSKKYMVNQGFMSLSTCYLEDDRHLARLHRRRRRRRRAYAPTSNTTSHDVHEKINSWVSFSFPYEYGAPLDGPPGRRSSAINILCFRVYPIYNCFFIFYILFSFDHIVLEKWDYSNRGIEDTVKRSCYQFQMKDRDSKIVKFIFITAFQIRSKLYALLQFKTPSTSSSTFVYNQPDF